MTSERKVACVLCELSKETNITGALSTKQGVTAHQNCLLFSSGICCTESPVFDDLFGFSVEDVRQEVKRGSKLTCSKCKKKGATVGCEVKRCKKSFHYPCAIEAEAELIEDEVKGRYEICCVMHKQQKQQSKGTTNELVSFSTKRTTSKDSNEAGTSKYCGKRAATTNRMNVNNDMTADGSSVYSSDSNSSNSSKRKRLECNSDNEEEISPKCKSGRFKRIICDSPDSDNNEPNADLAPLSSDLDESANSVMEHQFIRKNCESPSGSTSGNRPESKDEIKDEDVTFISDTESESLLPVEVCKEPPSPPTTSADLLSPTTSAAHATVILVETKDKVKECIPEKNPVHSPDQNSAGPSVPQQSSTGLLPSPDLSKSSSITGSPPYTSTAISPGQSETIGVPTLSSTPSAVAHSSQTNIDSISFWKRCNEAGCTQDIFANFINEMNKISGRIQSDQASQEDYDLALKVMLDSGKLAEILDKQEKALQRKQTDLRRVAETVEQIISGLKR
ncbi:PHD finger protein 11 [Anabas testudineus]|uniref:PHD-type domain-containing protein n=1 Tax=Anabas testudineus TaxID=64144 RepID=A0A3Q1JB72_ANATE|nr:PHD finger protein 11 [Anabas testudineus]